MDLQTLQTYENWPKEVLPGILFFGKPVTWSDIHGKEGKIDEE